MKFAATTPRSPPARTTGFRADAAAVRGGRCGWSLAWIARLLVVVAVASGAEGPDHFASLAQRNESKLVIHRASAP